MRFIGPRAALPIDGFLLHAGPHLMQPLPLGGLGHLFQIKVSREESVAMRHLTCHEEVQDCADAPEIALGGVLAAEGLGSVEAHGAVAGPAAARGAHGAPVRVRVVEVYEHDPLDLPTWAAGIAVQLHDEVVGLDVAVEHALRMHVVHCLQELTDQALDGGVGEDTIPKVRHKAAEEGPAISLVHNRVEKLVVLQNLSQRHHADVRREVEHADLQLPELLLAALPAEALLGADLHDVLAPPVEGALALAHHHLASVAVLLQDLIPVVSVKDFVIPEGAYVLPRRAAGRTPRMLAGLAAVVLGGEHDGGWPRPTLRRQAPLGALPRLRAAKHPAVLGRLILAWLILLLLLLLGLPLLWVWAPWRSHYQGS
mmetsp:Transcript_79250/g.246790  ORF Transcript_79250/g.246790 Transcript_79250/m.246790 type:complete len:369 (+) Transcript_79250:182-1288(+)